MSQPESKKAVTKPGITPEMLWQAFREVCPTLKLRHATIRYASAAVLMSIILLAMALYHGSPVPFVIVIFGDIALILTLRLPKLFIPAVVVAVAGSLLGMMIPWVFLSRIGVTDAPATLLSLVLSPLALGPLWLMEIGWDIVSQIELPE